MNRDEIRQILPHREPMLLIDEIQRVDDKHALGQYHVRGDEWFLQGHFPGQPIVPGVILCEMIAQTCCVIVMKKGDTETPYYAGINNLRFRGKVLPGDTVDVSCEMTAHRKPFYFVKATGKVGDTVCVTGEFSFALMDS